MGKSTTVIVITVVMALWVGALGVGFVSVIRSVGRARPQQVTIPQGKCPRSLAVFNFRPKGDPDAKYYAVGFARALADRTYCAPKHITQQMTINEIGGAISSEKKDPAAPVSDELAVKLGKKMAVAYVVTGDVTLSGGKADIAVHVIETADPESKQTYTASGSLADLPAMQSKLAPLVVSVMKIKPNRANSAELKTPNFTKPETLKLYGRSFLSKAEERESLRWKMLEMEPDSSFAFARLLDFYKSGPLSCAELRKSKRVAKALAPNLANFDRNSQIAVLRGLLLARQSRYQQAESVLKEAVKRDPEMVRVHTALAYVATLRQNSRLAVSEAIRAVELWPNNAYLRASLAEAYSLASSNARHGNYYTAMSWRARKEWKAYTLKSLEEAYTAVRLDPDCSDAWFSILNNSRELSRDKDIEKAYKELRRIEPKNPRVYTSYAFCFSPQWGGTDAEQERVFEDAEKAFPPGSYEPLLVRAFSLSSNSTSSGRVGGPYAGEVLKLSDEIIRKAGSECEDAIHVRSQAYQLTRRREDFLKVSKYAYEKWGGLTWQYRCGMGCAFAYEDKHDRAYLKKAAQLFGDYSREIPFDPRGYIQYGWCLSHLGKREEAKAQFLKALEIDPTNEVAKEKLKYVQ